MQYCINWLVARSIYYLLMLYILHPSPYYFRSLSFFFCVNLLQTESLLKNCCINLSFFSMLTWSMTNFSLYAPFFQLLILTAIETNIRIFVFYVHFNISCQCSNLTETRKSKYELNKQTVQNHRGKMLKRLQLI